MGSYHNDGIYCCHIVRFLSEINKRELNYRFEGNIIQVEELSIICTENRSNNRFDIQLNLKTSASTFFLGLIYVNDFCLFRFFYSRNYFVIAKMETMYAVFIHEHMFSP